VIRRLSHRSEGGKIRDLARGKWVAVLLTSEVEDALVSKGALRSDVLTVLRNSSVIGSELRGQQWRRTVRGCDADGRALTLVITVAYPQHRIVVLEVDMEPANEP